jgi:hypothetical protein
MTSHVRRICSKTHPQVKRILRTAINLLPMITGARPMGPVVRISRNSPDEPADNLITREDRSGSNSTPAIPSEVPKHNLEGPGPQNGPCAHGRVRASLEANSTVAI